MLQGLAFLGSAYVWFVYSHDFGLFLYRHAPEAYARPLYNVGAVILAALLIGGLWLLSAVTRAWQGRRWSDGVWNSSFGRRLIGLVVRGVLFAGLAGAAVLAVRWLGGRLLLTDLWAVWMAWCGRRQAKITLGRATRPLRWLIAGRHAGMGGSARFSGLLDEWANPWAPGKIMLGRSKYDPDWIVGMEDDRHVITIATTGAGKGRSAIIPNLLTWPGSALVIDPKGQNAYVTASARGRGGEGLARGLGQTVRIIDPMGEIQKPELQACIARLNPMAELDPGATDYAERVTLIADALVVPGSEKDTFWDNAARTLIAGLIDYTMMSPNVGREERNLVTVRGLLIHPDGPPLEEMAEMGGLAQAAAAGLRTGGENSTADVRFTAMTHTSWLDSVGMQKALSASDFSLRDLNDGNTTVYLVLPPDCLDIHGRFLRLFVNMSLHAATKGRKGRHETLFLLDEFYALGRMQLLAKASGLLRGYGVKLWPIIQNVGQLQELYPKNWETFLGNAGLWTVFAMNDASTARYLSERLGRRLLWRKMRGPKGFEWETAGAASLRDPLELGKDTSRESGTMAAFTESGEAFLLARIQYDRLFKPDQYVPDPFEPNGRMSVRAFVAALRKRWREARTPAEADEQRLRLASQPVKPLFSWWKARRKRGDR